MSVRLHRLLGSVSWKLLEGPQLHASRLLSDQTTSEISRNQGRKKMEQLQSNPFFNKYSTKLAELQRTNPEQFKRKIEEAKNAKDKMLDEKPTTTDGSNSCRKSESKPLYRRPQQLNDIMKVELLKDKTPQEISDIWKTYNSEKGFLTAVASSSMYATILKQSLIYPMFLYPLPREEGYEFFFAEFQGNQCYFTQLLMYQQKQADAPACLSITHFDELSEEKGIVLVRGEYDKNILNPMQVQCLLNQMQLYYGTDDKHKTALLDQFNKQPQSFRYDDLIIQLNQSFTLKNN